jgi:steroid 5-alpha reductase family enzyme
MSSHYRAAPQGWEIRPTPDYLLTGGPYRVSRNPTYVDETAIWAGWAVLFGSLPVTAGLLAVTAVQNGAIRVEERMLHKRWAAYDDYWAQVPRWLKLPNWHSADPVARRKWPSAERPVIRPLLVSGRCGGVGPPWPVPGS